MRFDEWELIKASDYCIKVADGTHDSPKRRDKGLPLITSKHIKGKTIDFESAYLISEKDYNKINLRSKVDQWDVLISMIGEYCGYCYVESNDKINYAVKNVGIFKAGDRTKAYWLYYYLNSAVGREVLNSLRSGTSQPYISLGALRALNIHVPKDKDTMQRVVSILSSLDDKIELNRQTNQTLEAIAHALFKEWFIDFNFPGATGEMVDSELGEIPKGWRVGKLAEVMEVKYGKDHKHLQSGSIPVYGSGGIMRFANKSLYEEESILIPRKGTLSNLFYINKPFWSVDTMFYTKIKLTNGGKYLFHLLLSLNLATMNVGSAVPSMTTEILNNLLVLIPPEDVLKKFEAVITSLFEQKEHNMETNQNLADLRDTLLPKLLKGEIKL